MFRNSILIASLALACSAPPQQATTGFEGDAPEPAPSASAGVAPQLPELAPSGDTDLPPAKKLQPIRYWVSPDVSERDGVEAAFDAWKQATAGVREWEEVTATPDEVNPETGKSPADVAVYEIGPYGGTCNDAEAGLTNVLGCVQGIGGLWNNQSGQAMPVFLVSTTFSADGHAMQGYQRNPKMVAMHEVAHLLGATHQGGGDLMHPTGPQYDEAWECPDAGTVDQIESRIHVAGFSSCEPPKE